MKKNKEKAQALIEFVLILPIILLVILGVVDIGRIFYTKTKLESLMSDTVRLIQKEEDLNNIVETFNKEEKKIVLTLEEKDNLINIQIKEELTLITPGFNLFLENPYPILVERILAYEDK